MTRKDDKVHVEKSVGEDVIEDSKFYIRQIVSSLVPILSTVVTGMTMGYSAVLLPQLKVYNLIGVEESERSYVTNATMESSNLDIAVQTDQKSWIAASAALTMAPGCWISSLLMDKLGRKTSFLVINPIALIGWLVIALAGSFRSLITGRLLCGLCVGLLGATSPVYIAETSHPRLRGLLLSALTLAVAIGIFFVHALGTWLNWRHTAYIAALIPIISFGMGVFVPGSPNWLLSQGKTEDALAVWILLRGDHSMAEFQDLRKTHERNTKVNEESESTGTDVTNWKTILSSRVFLMPLLIVCVFSLTSQGSGVNVVTFYCVELLLEVSGPGQAYLGTLTLDFLRVGFAILACWLTRHYPRRTLAMISGIGTFLTLASLSMSLFANFRRPWLPIGLLFLYTATVSIGFVPLPWLLSAELFDGTSRGLGSGLSAGFAFLCFFAVVKTGPLAFDVLTPGGTFALYGTVALLGTVFLYSFLPETKDKKLRDISSVFARRNSSSGSRKSSPPGAIHDNESATNPAVP